MNDFQTICEDVDFGVYDLHNKINSLKEEAGEAISNYHFLLNLLGAVDRDSAVEAIEKLKKAASTNQHPTYNVALGFEHSATLKTPEVKSKTYLEEAGI